MREPRIEQARRHEARHHREHTLGKVYDPGHSVNQDQPAREQREPAADDHAVHQVRKKRAHDAAPGWPPKYASRTSGLLIS